MGENLWQLILFLNKTCAMDTLAHFSVLHPVEEFNPVTGERCDLSISSNQE